MLAVNDRPFKCSAVFTRKNTHHPIPHVHLNPTSEGVCTGIESLSATPEAPWVQPGGKPIGARFTYSMNVLLG